MSQSSRARVKSLLNGRLGVAKMIVSEGFAIRHGRSWPAWDCTGDRPGPSLYLETFDVHAVKEFAESVLLGEAQDPYSTGRRKVARRLLAATEGQPSKCPTPECHSGRWLSAEAIDRRARGQPCHPAEDCPDCKGTGHNLRGTLPPIEWSPAIVVAVADCIRHDSPPNPGPRHRWTWLAYGGHASLRARVDMLVNPGRTSCHTRVCPRGWHRAIIFIQCPRGASQEYRGHTRICRGWPLVAWLGRLSSGGMGPHRHDAHVHAWRSWTLPRWRRGELKHARRQREQTAARKVGQP